MELSDLLLKKEEIAILHKSDFCVPIHPRLTQPDIILPRDIAYDVLPGVVEAWQADIKELMVEYDPKYQDWITEVFLSQKATLTDEGTRKIIKPTHFEPVTRIDATGFCSSFSISRDFGGSIYFNKSDSSARQLICPPFAKFSPEKFREYGNGRPGPSEDSSVAFIYEQHNVDELPGATLLRNWAIAYLNAAMTHILKK